jgi:hypothetical protein
MVFRVKNYPLTSRKCALTALSKLTFGDTIKGVKEHQKPSIKTQILAISSQQDFLSPFHFSKTKYINFNHCVQQMGMSVLHDPYQLNGRRLFVVFNSALSEVRRLYSHIYNLTISNGALNAIYSNAISCLTVRFSAVMIGIF